MTLGAARVMWSLVDLSVFIDEVVRGYVTMVVKSQRGPVGEAHLVSTMTEYRRKYGRKVSYTTDPLVAEMAIRQGGRLNLIRTAHYDDPEDKTTLTAVKSSMTFYDKGDSPNAAYMDSEVGPFTFSQKLSGRTTGTEVGPFTYTTGSTDKVSFSVQGGTGCLINILTVDTGAIATAEVGTSGGTDYNVGDILTVVQTAASGGKVTVATIEEATGEVLTVTVTAGGSGYSQANGKSTTCLGMTQTVTLAGTLTTQQTADLINSDTVNLTAISVYDEGSGEYVLKVYANNINHSLKVLSISHDCYTQLGISTGTYDADLGTDSFAITVDGGEEQVITITPPGGVEGDFRLTTGQMVIRFNNLLEGLNAVNYEGKVRIASNTTGGSSTLEMSECTARSVLGYDLIEREGSSIGTSLATLRIDAIDEGQWGDSVKIIFSPSSLHDDLYFNMRLVYDLQGDMEEWYPDMSMDSDSERYIVNYVNSQSFLIRVTDLHSANSEPLNMPLNNAPGVYLDGGYDGLDDFDDADWIGDAAQQTGIYGADTSYMSMDLMVPGTVSPTVYDAMITYCLGRGDMLGYGQTPFGNDPEDTVAWRMGTGDYVHPAFDSHRFSLWFGRPLVFDDRDSAKRYIPNLGHLASCLCKTDNDYGSQWAPVGPRRGVVQLVEGIDFNIQDYRSTGYSDLFAEYGINYLMISKMPGIEGAMFWEQRTTQRVPSATRELNVMRFITVVNRTLMPVLRTFLFEPNHPVTWREVHRVLQPAFDDWKNKYAIYDYCLQTDRDAFFDGGVLKNAVLNSGLDIDRGIYRCRALIQPTRAIYYLEFELGVMRTGESFDNYKSLRYLPGWVRQ